MLNGDMAQWTLEQDEFNDEGRDELYTEYGDSQHVFDDGTSVPFKCILFEIDECYSITVTKWPRTMSFHMVDSISIVDCEFKPSGNQEITRGAKQLNPHELVSKVQDNGFVATFCDIHFSEFFKGDDKEMTTLFLEWASDELGIRITPLDEIPF